MQSGRRRYGEGRGSSCRYDGGFFYFAFDLGRRARIQTADGVQLGAVFISQRQVEQEVFNAVNAKGRQRFCQRRTDTGQLRQVR